MAHDALPRCPPIEQLARSLGLAEHVVVGGARLWLPIDTEVHLASDGRLYVIDLARLMPPMPPGDGVEYLYRHFRPELLASPGFRRAFKQRLLSSDALSGFAGEFAFCVIVLK